MQKSRSSKGYTLIEVMVSLTIFTLFFITILCIYISSVKVKTYNNQIYKYTAYIEALKYNITYNLQYGDLNDIKSGDLRYIDKENISLEAIKTKGIKNLIVNTLPAADTYVKLNFNKGEIITIIAELHFTLFNQEETIICTCYKGNYI